MNIINLPNNSHAISRASAYSKSNFTNNKYTTGFAQQLNISAKIPTESDNIPISKTIGKTKYTDENAFFIPNRVDLASFTSQIASSSNNENESKTILTDDQSAAIRIMKNLGVNLRNEVNWKSDGTRQLTPLQIEDLKSRYDVYRLDTNEYCNLLVELVNSNVLSSDDLVKQFVHQTPPEVVRDGCLVYSSSATFSSKHDNIFNYIQAENQLLDDLLQAIDNRNTSLHESEINSVRRFYEKEKKQNQKLLDTFELLKNQ